MLFSDGMRSSTGKIAKVITHNACIFSTEAAASITSVEVELGASARRGYELLLYIK